MKHCLLLFSLSLLLSSCLSFYPCWPGSLYILNETGMPIHIETNIVSRTDIAGNSATGQQEIRSFDLDTDSCALLAKSGEVSDNESFTIEDFVVNCSDAYVKVTISTDAGPVERTWTYNGRKHSEKELFNLNDSIVSSDITLLTFNFSVHASDFGF